MGNIKSQPKFDLFIEQTSDENGSVITRLEMKHINNPSLIRSSNCFSILKIWNILFQKSKQLISSAINQYSLYSGLIGLMLTTSNISFQLIINWMNYCFHARHVISSRQQMMRDSIYFIFSIFVSGCASIKINKTRFYLPIIFNVFLAHMNYGMFKYMC